jgi:hypothetical protein
MTLIAQMASPLSEIALVLVRLDHVAARSVGLEALPPRREQSIHLRRQSEISRMRNGDETHSDK